MALTKGNRIATSAATMAVGTLNQCAGAAGGQVLNGVQEAPRHHSLKGDNHEGGRQAYTSALAPPTTSY